MKILHYMFGIPPVRVGGLIRYATDLMKKEMQTGQAVYLLIPGEIPKAYDRKTKILRRKQDYLDIPTYVIYNPLPIPMCNGILDIEMYTRKCVGKGFRDFLQWLRPELLHIHTFMGLHRELLAEAQNLGIPVLFTTHDYFGICPKADLMFEGNLCKDSAWKNCEICCQNAFSEKRLRIEQTKLYRFCRKHEWMIKIAKKLHAMLKSRQPQVKKVQETGSRVPAISINYKKLREYYISMFRMVSCFHYNSTIAEKIYTASLNSIRIKGAKISISHSMIKDCRRKRSYGNILRLGYLGSWAEHKGFYELLEVCRILYKEGYTDLELHIYSNTQNRKELFVRNHPGFKQNQLGEIMDAIDVLIVPSKWPETFGFVVLEALSYAVPVLISKYVGARDILLQAPEAGFVYDGTIAALKKQIKNIYEERVKLEKANQAILEMKYDFSYKGHVEKILQLYQGMVVKGGEV